MPYFVQENLQSLFSDQYLLYQNNSFTSVSELKQFLKSVL